MIIASVGAPSTMLRMVPLPRWGRRRGGAICISCPTGGGGPPEGWWRGPSRLAQKFLVAASAFALASPALADCASDFALGTRTHAPFDRALAERVPNTVILGRIEAAKAKLTAEMRPLATLAPMLNVWFHDRKPEEMFRVLFTGPLGDDAPKIAQAFAAIGAERQAGAVGGAIGAFGKRYPDMAERSRRFGPYHGPPTDLAKAVLANAPVFGTRAEFVEALATYACARPAVVAWLEAERAKTDPRDNLAWLTYELLTSRQIEGSPDEVAAQLAELPEPYRTLYLVRYADFEVGNGGIHQLFSNSSGNIAGHVPEALRRIGLDKHAGLVERGLAMFPHPYPTDRAERDRVAFGTTDPRTGKPKNPAQPDETWGAFDDELAALTGKGTRHGWSYDAIEPAALAFAKREGMVPK